MKRIYHNHNLWEEVKYGMYNPVMPSQKENMLKSVIHFFNTKELVEEYMLRVIKEFKYSCEHNLTNPSMNKIAFIGQSAVALWGRIPEAITREAWSYLSEDTQSRANLIALEKIEEWEQCQKDI